MRITMVSARGLHGAFAGRNGHRQGSDRASNPRRRSATTAALRGRELRCDSLAACSKANYLVTNEAHSPGAIAQSVGRFQAADGGTLFLDEIGDLPLDLQPKLLRALQGQQIERLGSSGRATAVDVRVIAATNQDLAAMVEQRSFRADLFYRLNVFPIRIPPLRERAEDIPLLIHHFVRQFAKRQGKEVEEVPDDVIATLKHHTWPGEHSRAAERDRASRGDHEGADVGRCRGPKVARAIPRHPRARSPKSSGDHIMATLQATNGVLGGWDGAAARLGLSRTTLISRMQRLGLAAGSGLRKG